MSLPKTCRFSIVIAACSTLLGTAQVSNPKSAVQLQNAYGTAQRLHEQNRFADAATTLEPFYTSGPGGSERFWYVAMYDLACDEALAGNRERAIEVLQASQSNGGSTGSDHIATDNDLLSLHGDPRFTRLVEEVKSHERLWTREPGQETPYTSDLSEDAKVAGLSVFWAEARFNFAFFDRQPGLDWNQLYLDFLLKVSRTSSTEDYYRLLMRFAAELKDGHTNVYPPDALADAFYGGPGLRTALVENQIVVTAVHDPGLTEQGWRIGDVLQKIGNEDVHTYAKREIVPFQSASTLQDLDVRTFGYPLLGGKAGSNITVTVEDAQGRQSNRTLERLTVTQRTALRHVEDAAFALRADGIAVLTVNEFEDGKGADLLLANLAQVNGSKGLVIDVRANGGGSTPIRLLQILADSPIPGAIQRTRSYVAVDRARGMLPGWSDLPTEQIPQSKDQHVAVPVVVLTSAMTFSAAEDFVAAFNAIHRGTTIGETTGGSTGQPFFFHLPGGGSARICTKNDRSGDGTVFEGKGLMPQVPIAPTISSVRSHQDPVLKRGVEVLLSAKH
jgi:carboxyl-terminal processing protease